MNPDPEINQIYLEIESISDGKYFSLITYQFDGLIPDHDCPGLLSSFRLIGARQLKEDISGLLIGGRVTLNTVPQTANWLRTLYRPESCKNSWLNRVRRWLSKKRPPVLDESVTYFKVSEEEGTHLPIVESFRCVNRRSLIFQDLRHGRLLELSADLASALIDPPQLAERLMTAAAHIQVDKTSRFTPDYRDANAFSDAALRVILRKESEKRDRFFAIDCHEPQPSIFELGETPVEILGYLKNDDDTSCIAFLSNSLIWKDGGAIKQLPYDQIVTTGFHRWDKLGSKVPLCADLQLDCRGFSVKPHEVLPLLERLKHARSEAISQHATINATPVNCHDQYADCIPPQVIMRMR